MPVRVSIILPVLNEAALIVPALQRLAEQAPQAERIVADGGSSDDTVEQARPWAQVIVTPSGRARQMNAGAAAASGEWLLFLHVDTRLPEGFLEDIDIAEARGFQAGAFRLRIAGRYPALPVLAWAATQRTKWCGIAFGDQALFVRRELFAQRGGFPDLPLMEDYAWTRDLRRAGMRLYLSKRAVTTSGRRWDEHGFWRTWWRMRRNQWHFVRTGEAATLARTYHRTP
jgi:rSAM/selenodomain-associated transferase 2